MRIPRILAIVAAAVALRRAAAAPAAAAAPPALLVEIAAGPTIGMDRFLRGGKAAIAVGLVSGSIAAALRSSLSYDASLRCFFAQAGIILGLGGGTRLEVGSEFPLGAPSLAVAGRACPLEAAPWPNAFALAVALGGPGAARAEMSAGTTAKRGTRPKLGAAAELSYVAYRVAEPADPAAGPAPAAAGVAGFSAGFRAFLGARLVWLFGGGAATRGAAAGGEPP